MTIASSHESKRAVQPKQKKEVKQVDKEVFEKRLKKFVKENEFWIKRLAKK